MFKYIPLIIVFCLAGCQKNEFSYIEEARRFTASGEPLKAEKVLQEGLREYPSNQYLKKDYADLLHRTARSYDLAQYLKINNFERAESYWSEVAHDEFERANWNTAYEYFVKAGDTVLMYRPQECNPLAAEAYRNAIVSKKNAGDLAEQSFVLEQMSRIAQNCRRCATCEDADKQNVLRLSEEIGLR